MTSHTKEPWKYDNGFIVGRFSDGIIHNICDPRCAPPDADNSPEMDANTDRIMACVNVLAGVPTEDIEMILSSCPNDLTTRLRCLATVCTSMT